MAEVETWHGLTEDEILSRIECGESIAQIAESKGKERSVLHRWLNANESRSARARVAREVSAQAYDERAEAEIKFAGDPFELARAKEMAHHLRWRAAKIAPKTYGDKQQIEHSGSVSIGDTLREARLKRRGGE